MVDKIKGLCLKKGITLTALESELGFGNGSIRKWDSSSPSIDKVLKVANYFGVDINTLIGGDTKIVQPTKELDRKELIAGIISMFNSLEKPDQALALTVLETIRQGNEKTH